MKKAILLFLILNIIIGVSAQNVGIGTTTPNSNALLEISSSTKGILIPRTSTTTRSTIPAVKGLLVYDTTTSSFWFNDGVNWIETLNGNNGWRIAGNSNINDAVNFIGTTTSQALKFRANNFLFGQLNPVNNNVSFGLNTLSASVGGYSNQGQCRLCVCKWAIVLGHRKRHYLF